MPFVVIMSLIILFGGAGLAIFLLVDDWLVDVTVFKELLLFFGLEIILLGSAIFGAIWLSTASNNEELGWETFHNIVIDVRNGQDIKCVWIKDKFLNLNTKFGHVIKEGTFVRRYANKHWNCGVYTVYPSVYYDLIGTEHKRYAEVKDKMNKDVQSTTKPVN